MHDTWHVMAALRAMHQLLEELKRDVTELKDTLSVMDRGGGAPTINFVLGGSDDDEEDGEEDELSVASAPPTVSYEREDE